MPFDDLKPNIRDLPLFKEQILHIFGPREPFADVPLFIGGPYPATAQALEDTRRNPVATRAPVE
jgi:CRP/FNR family transcriptional regulator